jgi:Ni2+-binding GTPase involved in maturation of urease and hydrogenase
MRRRFPALDLILIESGGDNLAATFSPELADLTRAAAGLDAHDPLLRQSAGHGEEAGILLGVDVVGDRAQVEAEGRSEMSNANGPLRVGIGGPVGSGKTALMEGLCLRQSAGHGEEAGILLGVDVVGDRAQVEAVAQDLGAGGARARGAERRAALLRGGLRCPTPTDPCGSASEEAGILLGVDVVGDRAQVEAVAQDLAQALHQGGLETGGCPHTAIREDASINLAAVAEMRRRFPALDLILIGHGEEAGILLGVDVVGDRAQVEAVAQDLAQALQCRTACGSTEGRSEMSNANGPLRVGIGGPVGSGKRQSAGHGEEAGILLGVDVVGDRAQVEAVAQDLAHPRGRLDQPRGGGRDAPALPGPRPDPDRIRRRQPRGDRSSGRAPATVRRRASSLV